MPGRPVSHGEGERGRTQMPNGHDRNTLAHGLALAVALTVAAVTWLVVSPDRAGVDRASASVRRHGAAFAPPSRQRRSSADAARVTVWLASGPPVRPLPRSYFGLSIEYWGVLRFAQHSHLFARAMSLVRVPGDGPQSLRIGGDSSDQAYWQERRLPPGRPHAFALGQAWLADARRLVALSHARVLVGLNAIANSARMAAGWARATLRSLPRGTVAGFEVGNEPDIYDHRYRLGYADAIRWGHPGRTFRAAYTAAGYVTTFEAYANAVHRVAPHLPVAGPSVANPLRGSAWIADVVDDERGSIGLVTGHRYPLSACYRHRRFAPFPTIAKLLGEDASAGMAASVAPAALLAHRHRLRFRLTEFNSVTCGGRVGVSNTFANALWAPDALFELWRAGVDGVNLHVRTDTVNAPFTFTRSGLVSRPLMYGVITFVRALGPGARLVPLSVAGAPTPHLKLWGVRVGRHALRVLAINKSDRSVSLALRLRGAHGRADVQRLIAPSPSSKGGVTLAGQSLNAHGRWVGRRRGQTVAARHGAYNVSVRGYSAALVSVRLH